MKKEISQILLPVALLLGIETFCQTCTPVITNGLAAYYPFCGNPNDASGNGNNGALNGPILTTDRFNSPNSAYSFNGTGDYIIMPSGSATTLDITGDFTYSFWLKTTQGSNHILALGDNIFVNSGGYLAGMNAGGVPYGKLGFATQGLWNGSADTLNDGNWHNVTVILKADTVRMYLDNVLNAQFTGAPPPLSWNGTRAIGCRNDYANGFFQGVLDDIYIFNRALSLTEVSLLFNPASVGAPDASLPMQAGIFPNPAEDYFNISLSDAGSVTVDVISMRGDEVKSFKAFGKDIKIDCSDLPSGIYFVRVRTSHKITEWKLAVIRQ